MSYMSCVLVTVSNTKHVCINFMRTAYVLRATVFSLYAYSSTSTTTLLLLLLLLLLPDNNGKQEKNNFPNKSETLTATPYY